MGMKCRAAIRRFCMAVVLNVHRATYVKQIAAHPMAARRMAHHLSGCTSKITECGRADADGENSRGKSEKGEEGATTVTNFKYCSASVTWNRIYELSGNEKTRNPHQKQYLSNI